MHTSATEDDEQHPQVECSKQILRWVVYRSSRSYR